MKISCPVPVPGRVVAVVFAGLFALLVGGCAALTPERVSEIQDNSLVRNRGANKDQWWDALPRPAWTQLERVPTALDQGWFEVYRVRPGVLAIYEPGQFEEVISYLIEGEVRAVLFDTGLGIGDMASLVAGLTQLPVTVINSHTHYDHIGGNYQFENVLATSTAFTRRNSGGNPHEDVAEFVGEGWIWKPTPAAFNRDRYRTRAFTISGHLSDGQIMDLGGRRLEVLLTPGHAPDALCLLDRDNRLLFTGDTFYPAPLYAHLPGSDVRQYASSAERLARLAREVDVLLPGHNEPQVDPAYLPRLTAAFRSIRNGEASRLITDGNREYVFDGFSIILPPPSEAAGNAASQQP